ncbi:MAG: hypothetical protein CL506_03895 [Actinobacteria bacterium]|nr:hypothetical protein [Actinomycetota bacterium]
MEIWILLPLFSALLMAIVNVVDKFFVLEGADKLNFKSFCLYSGGMQIIICIVMFLLDPFSIDINLISREIFFLLMSGVCYGISLILLIKGMELEEISRVEPVYLIHTIIVPIFALFLLAESLTFFQYLGISLIFGSSLFASIRWTKNLSLINSSAILSLLLGAVFIAIGNVLLKYSVDRLAFSHTQILSVRAMGLFFGAGLPFFRKAYLNELTRFFKHKKRGLILFVAETLFPLLSMFMIVVALTKLEVSVVNAFNGVRPIFTVFLSTLLALIIKKSSESIDLPNIFIKVLSGILAGLGIVLLA